MKEERSDRGGANLNVQSHLSGKCDAPFMVRTPKIIFYTVSLMVFRARLVTSSLGVGRWIDWLRAPWEWKARDCDHTFRHSPTRSSHEAACVLAACRRRAVVEHSAFLCRQCSVLATWYFKYAVPGSLINFVVLEFMFVESATFLDKYHVTIGAAYTVMAVPYLAGFLRMIVASVRASKLVFMPSRKRPRIESPASSATRSRSSSDSDRRAHGIVNVFLQSINMQGQYFSLVLLGMESIEVLLQTWQAYRASKYIGNLLVNQLYGIMIFVNCCSSPLLHRFWEHKRNHPLMARFLCVLCDAMLDFAWGVMLQGVLFSRYWAVFLDQDGEVLVEMLHVPESPDRELRQILVVSASNFLLSVFPFFTSALIMHEICSLMRSAKISSFSTVGPTKAGPTADDILGQAHPRLNHSNVVRIHSICMMVYGVIILAISITSTGVFWEQEATQAQCVDRLSPWLRKETACVGRQLNCSSLGITGKKKELEVVLKSVSPYLLGNLVFTNCHGLEMPSAIFKFEELSTIAIHHSTLVQWDEDAAITNTSLPVLLSLHMMNVRVNCTPEGILRHRYPPTFQWVRFMSTHAQAFMHEVVDEWASTVYFTCYDCGLLSVPRAVKEMNELMSLQLGYNPLEDDAAEIVDDKPMLGYIGLAGPPLMTLTEKMKSLLPQLVWLDLQFTGLAEVPDTTLSLESNLDLAIWASGTPLCAKHNQSASSSTSVLICETQTPVI